jgi:MoaA/NifB/PqqE/SkfB family radical SAM enzyme
MMPTVMLTTHCPNACPWCFARPKKEEYRARGIREMSWDDFVAVVDFYERSGLRKMILLGGEPGLHSRFMDILHLLSGRKFLIQVGTTGILPESLVDGIVEAGFQELILNTGRIKENRWTISFTAWGEELLSPIRSQKGILSGRESNRFWTGLP